MKISITTLFICLSCNIAFSQPETDNNKRIFGKFRTYYNTDQTDSIFAMFSPDAKINLPLTKTTAFLAQLKNRFGNIKAGEFMSYQSSFAQYRTDFEKGKLSLNLAVNERQQITGLFAKPYEEVSPAILKINTTHLQLPFNGEWTVFWGGDTKELNQHVGVEFQRGAFDIIITNKENKSYGSDGRTNGDYYAFGQSITAPCAGEIVLAVDGVQDNVPGVVNTLFVPGNTIMIKTINNEYIFMAHFKQHSIRVKQGEKVRPGQVLGLCGNSGNSSEPHLHFHIQDKEEPLQAAGLKCNFDSITMDGAFKTNYSPVKGNRVSNFKK